MKVYKNAKLAISNLANVNKNRLKKIPAYGMENDCIYSNDNKIYKVTSSKQEFLASKRIIGKKFKNIVKIFDSYECNILSDMGSVWKSYIIEEEKLKREKRKFVFDSLDLCVLSENVKERLPYFVSVINGLAELDSIGIKYKDLHSMNIMNDNDGNVKIIDFGYVSLKKDFH